MGQRAQHANEPLIASKVLASAIFLVAGCSVDVGLAIPSPDAAPTVDAAQAQTIDAPVARHSIDGVWSWPLGNRSSSPPSLARATLYLSLAERANGAIVGYPIGSPRHAVDGSGSFVDANGSVTLAVSALSPSGSTTTTLAGGTFSDDGATLTFTSPAETTLTRVTRATSPATPMELSHWLVKDETSGFASRLVRVASATDPFSSSGWLAGSQSALNFAPNFGAPGTPAQITPLDLVSWNIDGAQQTIDAITTDASAFFHLELIGTSFATSPTSGMSGTTSIASCPLDSINPFDCQPPISGTFTALIEGFTDSDEVQGVLSLLGGFADTIETDPASLSRYFSAGFSYDGTTTDEMVAFLRSHLTGQHGVKMSITSVPQIVTANMLAAGDTAWAADAKVAGHPRVEWQATLTGLDDSDGGAWTISLSSWHDLPQLQSIVYEGGAWMWSGDGQSTPAPDAPACPSPVFSQAPFSKDDLTNTLASVSPIGVLTEFLGQPYPALIFNAPAASPPAMSVYAPADLMVEDIGWAVTGSSSVYTIEYRVCDKVIGALGKMDTLEDPALVDYITYHRYTQAISGSETEYQWTLPPFSTIAVKAGTRVGTAGKKSLRWHARDLSLGAEGTTGISALHLCSGTHMADDYMLDYEPNSAESPCYTVCALDYLDGAVADLVTAKMADQNGQFLDTKNMPTRCGILNRQDIAGTPRGEWFASPTDTMVRFYAGENPFRSCAHRSGESPPDPCYESFTTTVQLPGDIGFLPMGVHSFVPRSAGNVNRSFATITDDGVYCYESMYPDEDFMLATPMSQPVSVVLLRYDPAANTVSVEYQRLPDCSAGNFALTSNAVTYQR